MIALTEATRLRIRALFPADDQATVERALLDRCGDTLPLVSAGDPKAAERIRIAVLKISGGDLARLEDALALAAIDWRDVLVEAGFADDIGAHLAWMP